VKYHDLSKKFGKSSELFGGRYVLRYSIRASFGALVQEGVVLHTRVWRRDVRSTEEGGSEMIRLYAAGHNAVAVVEDGKVGLTLEGGGARCVAVDPEDPDTLYVGTTDEGLFKSEDGGEDWERISGIEHPRVTSVAVSPVDGAVYAGTEPSTLFVSRDGGASWRELEGLKNLPSAPTWSFPPRPWTSHVRAIALSHENPDLVVAGIELGGVMRSPDGGETWEDQRPGAYADCHALAAHPASSETLYEAAGGGFAESEDFGESWEAADAGMGRWYVWGLAVDPEDPTLVYSSAAPGPFQAHGPGFSDAAIYRRRERGQWEAVIEGLAAFPYALCADPEQPGSVYAGLGDGKILHSPDAGESWDEIAEVHALDDLVAVRA
jgi:photosystem II stability/assembly factor-like uncharacterized protein